MSWRLLNRFVLLLVGGKRFRDGWSFFYVISNVNGKLGKLNGTGRVPTGGSRGSRGRAPRPRPKCALDWERLCCPRCYQAQACKMVDASTETKRRRLTTCPVSIQPCNLTFRGSNGSAAQPSQQNPNSGVVLRVLCGETVASTEGDATRLNAPLTCNESPSLHLR
jgi:hypothetical protein